MVKDLHISECGPERIVATFHDTSVHIIRLSKVWVVNMEIQPSPVIAEEQWLRTTTALIVKNYSADCALHYSRNAWWISCRYSFSESGEQGRDLSEQLSAQTNLAYFLSSWPESMTKNVIYRR